MDILEGVRSEKNKMVYDNYVYHHDYRYLNIYRCSQRNTAHKCTAELTVRENREDVFVEGLHNHPPPSSVLEDSALRKEIKRLACETMDTSTDILRAASLF